MNFIKNVIKILILLYIAIFLCNCSKIHNKEIEKEYIDYESTISIDPSGEYFNKDNYLYRIVNNNNPAFNILGYNGKAFEQYSELDELGRCGVAEALSYEDRGIGIKMNILLENYQPGIHIDYATGDSYEKKKE